MKRRATARILRALVGIVVIGLVGFVAFAQGQDIRLGVIAPLSGGGTSYGIGIKRGAEMAVGEINAAGGINGRQIKIYIVDDASNPAESVSAMQRLISQDHVDVIVGGWGSSQVLAHQATVERAGVPYIIVGATNPKITTTKNKWTFRVIKSDANQAVEIANAAVKTLNLKRIAVLYDSNDYGTGNKDVFVAALKKMGLEPVSVASYGTNDKDFTAQLSEVKAANPDGLAVFGTIPAAPAIMIQARQLGINAQFIGTGGLANEQLISLGGSAVEGTVLTTYFDSATTPDAQAWAKAYEAKYAGQSPPPRPILAAWEYRAIKQILAPCLEKVGTDKNAIRECLHNFNGKVIGFDQPVHFDDTNQLVQPTILVQVKDGKFVLYH